MHPNWFRLPCGVCRLHRIEGGVVRTDQDGRAVRAATPVPCYRTPCGDYANKPRISNDWLPILEKYELCKSFEFHIPPRAGGLNDQNWLEIHLFAAIRLAERRAEAELMEQAERRASVKGR